MIRVWDPFVRVFHWSLVAAVAIAWLTGDESEGLHVIAGYVVAGLVAARLVWGLVGSRYARFTQFVRKPGVVLAYLRAMLTGREHRYLGHNPAAAAMIVALLLTLSGMAFTGWLLDDPARIAALPELPPMVAAAAADEDGDRNGGSGVGEDFVEEVHELLANGLLLLIFLHVGGVLLASVRHHENLSRSMITGDKRPPGPGDIA